MLERWASKTPSKSFHLDPVEVDEAADDAEQIEDCDVED
jgi:hypothetical protein